MNKPTFLWHDYETFGANPKIDRPCQFAALRTDEFLNPIDDPVIYYCQPNIDTLPHPRACWITGITPQYAQAHGLPEYEFAKAVYEVMAKPGTCAVGYNNLRFDDEVSRHLFWRNFIDPYAREYANGNSRFDLINLLRLMRALRPEGIEWTNYEDGQPSFRLEDLANANGLDTSQAHDALADVENTLAMAQRVMTHQPKLWSWALSLRQKHTVDGLLATQAPLIFASAYYAQKPGSIAVVLPLARHPRINNQWLVWDLSFNPTEILSPNGQSPDEIQRAELPLPVSSIKINACPMLAPMSVLDGETQQRLSIDPEKISEHQRALLDHPEWVDAVLAQYRNAPAEYAQDVDAELDLYGGFVPRQDQALVGRIGQMSGEELASLQDPFTDPRLNALLFRYRARHWPESLDPSESEKWLRDRHARLITGEKNQGLTLDEYLVEVELLASDHPEATDLIQALKTWPEHLEIEALTGT